MTDPTPEDWLPIAGFEGYYEVSSWGQIRSVARTVPHGYSGQVRIRERILRPCPTAPYGYLRVMLSRDGVERSKYVHQLVAVTFHGPRPAGMEVLHGPGGRWDNSASNLSWGTARANSLDKHRDGTMHQANKRRCPRGHPLETPNLHAATLRRGLRNCLACNRAMSYVRHARNRHGVILDLQATADRYYAEIMAAAA